MPGAHFCAEWFLEISIPPQLKKFGTQLCHMSAVDSLPVTVGRVDTDEQTGCPLLPCQIMTLEDLDQHCQKSGERPRFGLFDGFLDLTLGVGRHSCHGLNSAVFQQLYTTNWFSTKNPSLSFCSLYLSIFDCFRLRAKPCSSRGDQWPAPKRENI